MPDFLKRVVRSYFNRRKKTHLIWQDNKEMRGGDAA